MEEEGEGEGEKRGALNFFLSLNFFFGQQFNKSSNFRKIAFFILFWVE